jgi:predicted Zn-dependent protease
MNNEKLDIIKKNLELKKIQEYEIYLVENHNFETQFIKNKIDAEREVNDFEYIIRILSQKGDETGIGIVKGNSLNAYDIDKNIKACKSLAKSNSTSKYTFPEKTTISQINIADQNIIKDPIGIKKEISDELITEIEKQRDVTPTFGRFRVQYQKSFLNNSNGIDLDAKKTFFYLELSLKAQENGKLAEYWDAIYIKERAHLDLEKRIGKWASSAKDTLRAKIPQAKKPAIVIFPPGVLKNAINPVVGFHALGKAFHEKVTKFNLEEKVASDNFNIFDNGLLEGGLLSNSWDGEGNAHQKNEVIKDGIFKMRLFDQKYAILSKTKSTGNGIRTNNGSVINDISNLQILPGDISLEEMISNLKEGYYIEKFSWLNPDDLSGSFGAEIRKGYYIKDGSFINPIKGGNVSGNILEMIKNCQFISKELEYSFNSLFPYILFSNLTVSS